MDKLAEEFRKAHLERQELLQQWEGTINQMKRRDAEIDASADVSIYTYMFNKRKENLFSNSKKYIEHATPYVAQYCIAIPV